MDETTKNPFSPKFGKRPELFIGRDGIMEDFLDGLASNDDLHQSTILTGIRGSGKTAILSAIRESLNTERYLVVDVTAHNGMLVDIVDECIRNGKTWLKTWSEGVSGFSVGALGFSFGMTRKEDSAAHGFRYTITNMLEVLARDKVRVVFLIDEVHNKTPDMREFAITYQHLIREDRGVALMMAGLPSAVQDILNDDVLTFLRRAHRVNVRNINIDIVRNAYKSEFESIGCVFTSEALQEAASATEGYPYLFQLVGYFLWKTGRKRINHAVVDSAVTRAKVELFQNIHDLMYQGLSSRDKEFLKAMVSDSESSSFGDIAKRLGMKSGNASVYRQRLLDAGALYSPEYGKLSFALPFMREYLQSK